MRFEYDFRRQRGKFFKTNAEQRLPVYLEPEIQRYLAERTMDKGVPLSDRVNGMLRGDIQILESAK